MSEANEAKQHRKVSSEGGARTGRERQAVGFLHECDEEEQQAIAQNGKDVGEAIEARCPALAHLAGATEK
jgi:hypothetical protein